MFSSPVTTTIIQWLLLSTYERITLCPTKSVIRHFAYKLLNSIEYNVENPLVKVTPASQIKKNENYTDRVMTACSIFLYKKITLYPEIALAC